MVLNFSEYVQNNAVFKFAVETSSRYRDNLVPILLISLFGGTAFYLIGTKRRNGLVVGNAYVKNNAKGCSTTTDISFEDIPIEARIKIWKNLKYEDILNLRLVCNLSKCDVERFVGLKLRINSKNMDEYEFAQRVSLQNCTITDLPNEIDSDFFLNPYLMSNLKIIERTPIPLNNLKNSLLFCINLKRLELHFLYQNEISDISEIVLNSLQRMQQLQEFKLFRLASNSPTLKSVDHNNTTANPNVPVPVKLIHVEIEIPDVSEEQVAKWINLLKQQTKLQTLTINFGAVHWVHFQKIIPKNPELQQIGLVGICNIARPGNEDYHLKPFDWGMFANCFQLESLEASSPPIINSQEVVPMNSTNFQAFPGETIEEFYVYKITLSSEDVRRIYLNMPKLKNGSLNQIGDAGNEAVAEMFWVQRQQEETVRNEWIDSERFWDVAIHSLIGLSILSVLFVASRDASNIMQNGSD